MAPRDCGTSWMHCNFCVLVYYYIIAIFPCHFHSFSIISILPQKSRKFFLFLLLFYHHTFIHSFSLAGLFSPTLLGTDDWKNRKSLHGRGTPTHHFHAKKSNQALRIKDRLRGKQENNNNTKTIKQSILQAASGLIIRNWCSSPTNVVVFCFLPQWFTVGLLFTVDPIFLAICSHLLNLLLLLLCWFRRRSR